MVIDGGGGGQIPMPSGRFFIFRHSYRGERLVV
jgi:hypothetical protein